MAKKKTAEKNNLKVKKKSSFSFNEMPIVSIRKDKKTILTLDDLVASLADYGINIQKPAYFTWTEMEMETIEMHLDVVVLIFLL